MLVSDDEPTFFWPAWEESSEIETNGDVVAVMKKTFGDKFRGDSHDGWILSLAVHKLVSDGII